MPFEESPLGPVTPVPGTPDIEEGRLLDSSFGMSKQESTEHAKNISEAHRGALRARRQRDLTSEMYMYHIDGEGDAQWSDIWNGTSVRIPPSLYGGLRYSRNLERPLVENMIAHHTAQRFNAVARAKADPDSRDRARVDTALANEIIYRGNLNLKFAEALSLAVPAGFCPMHIWWRHDMGEGIYEQVAGGESEQPMSGFADVWVGDPFDTVFNKGAKRHSCQWLSYGRVLPARLVELSFGLEEGSLEGRTDLPSASTFQRITRRWAGLGPEDHGTAVVYGEFGGDELIAVVFLEIAPGIDPDYPQGSLQIVALEGAAETDTTWTTGQVGRPKLLHIGPLPGGDFSAKILHTGWRGDDILGYPWIKDIDTQQIMLNQFITLEAEYLRRFARPPLKTVTGKQIDNSVTTEDDAVMEFDDPQSAAATDFLYPPAQGAGIYERSIQRCEQYIFMVGGWQAASRGESHAGDAASKIRMLAQFDDTVHAPVQASIRRTLIDVLKHGHRLAKQYLASPLSISEIVGEDLGFVAQPFIHHEQLSDETPHYEIVSAYGTTPEARDQMLIQMVTTPTADGQPLLDRNQFWRLYSDAEMRPIEIGAQQTREGRAKSINNAIKQIAIALEQQLGDQALTRIFEWSQIIMQEFPLLPTDPDEIHVEILDQIVQNEQESKLARRLAAIRQRFYLQRQMERMQAQAGRERETERGPKRSKVPARREPRRIEPPKGPQEERIG